MKKVSIVVPVYNEAEVLTDFFDSLCKNIKNLDVLFEIIFVLDPSVDESFKIIENFIQKDSRVKLIELSRRFGQPAAIICGLENASGDAVIVMDADLQDPPQVIPEMVKEWLNGNLIVLAMRESRSGENIAKKFVAKVGYGFLNKFAEIPIPKNVGDFRLLDKKIVNFIKEFKESGVFLRGIVSLVGFPYKTVFFERPKRPKGKTKYNKFFGSLKIGLEGIVGYSTILLKISTFTGVILTLFSIGFGSIYIFLKVFGFPFPVGNPTIVAIVLFMGAINLLSIGILGMYVAKISEDVKGRPRYFIKNKINF